MTSTARLVLLGLGAALVLLPLGLRRPGIPLGLRADEPSHYLLAQSLVHDGDAAVTAADIDRYFREFPYSAPLRLELGTDAVADDGGDAPPTLRFAVEPLYALALTPWVALGRADAAWAFNALCFVLALALVGRHLAGSARDPGLAWALAGGALFLSAAFVYVFWIHPASLRLFLVAVAFGLGWSRRQPAAPPSGDRAVALDAALDAALPRSPLPALAGGLCLGLAAAEVPWLLALAPAFLCRGRVLSKLLGLVAGGLLALSASWLVLGHVTPDGFARHGAFVAETPDDRPTTESLSALAADTAGLLPMDGFATSAHRIVLAFVDGRRGLLALFPFVLLALLPLVGRVWRRGRSRLESAGDASAGAETSAGVEHGLLLAGLSVLVVSRPFVLPDGADLTRFGDPVLVAAWPACLFLLPLLLPLVAPESRRAGRLSKGLVLGVGFVSALVLMPTISTPFLPPVPAGDAHHAGRGGLLSLLPTGLEEVAEAGGYERYEVGGSGRMRLWLPAWTHEALPEGFSFLGGIEARGWIELDRDPDAGQKEDDDTPSEAPPAGLHLRLGNFAPENHVRIRVGDAREERLFPGIEPPESTRIRFAVADSWKKARRRDGTPVWVTPFRVETSTGEKPFWRTDQHRDHYTGVELSILGSDAHLERQVFGVEWLGCGAPQAVAAGESFRALVRLRNDSAATWTVRGPARVRLGHRWRSAERSRESAVRNELPSAVEPGGVALTWVTVTAPTEAGDWTLEIEPIFESVAWFSDRTDHAVCTAEIVVEPSPTR